MPRLSQDHMDARRGQILSGARECFAEFGFEGATVRRLEEATGLSRGAIFHYFADKDALFLELADEDAAAMAETVAAQGLVQVMREILADPREFSWLGTRLEIARRIRTDPVFRERWTDRQAEVDAAVLADLHTLFALATVTCPPHLGIRRVITTAAGTWWEHDLSAPAPTGPGRAVAEDAATGLSLGVALGVPARDRDQVRSTLAAHPEPVLAAVTTAIDALPAERRVYPLLGVQRGRTS